MHMKKFHLIISLLLLFANASYAQVYSRKIIMDRYDDILSSENVKTIIRPFSEDGMKLISIDEKRHLGKLYCILEDLEERSIGSADHPEVLAGKAYGYQVAWRVTDLRGMKKMTKLIDKEEETGDYQDIDRESTIAVHRVILDPKTNEYVTELWWFQKVKNGRRIIYEK